MIVDTSALVAVARDEQGREPIQRAVLTEGGSLPAPALVEFRRVTALGGNRADPDAEALIALFLSSGLAIEPFTSEDARLAAAANEQHGTGNGRSGRLNMLDLMVYAVAKRTKLPILCTGRDFATTDIDIHPASRGW